MTQAISRPPGTGASLPARQQSGGQLTSEMPNTDSVASLPRKNRRSARKLAEFITEQYRLGLDLRAPHAVSWIKVKSIMRNVHYFKIRNGVWWPLRKKPGQIRAVRL